MSPFPIYINGKADFTITNTNVPYNNFSTAAPLNIENLINEFKYYVKVAYNNGVLAATETSVSAGKTAQLTEDLTLLSQSIPFYPRGKAGYTGFYNENTKNVEDIFTPTTTSITNAYNSLVTFAQLNSQKSYNTGFFDGVDTYNTTQNITYYTGGTTISVTFSNTSAQSHLQTIARNAYLEGLQEGEAIGYEDGYAAGTQNSAPTITSLNNQIATLQSTNTSLTTSLANKIDPYGGIAKPASYEFNSANGGYLSLPTITSSNLYFNTTVVSNSQLDPSLKKQPSFANDDASVGNPLGLPDYLLVNYGGFDWKITPDTTEDLYFLASLEFFGNTPANWNAQMLVRRQGPTQSTTTLTSRLSLTISSVYILKQPVLSGYNYLFPRSSDITTTSTNVKETYGIQIFRVRGHESNKQFQINITINDAVNHNTGSLYCTLYALPNYNAYNMFSA